MQPAGEFVSIATIAENLSISFHFLTKILQSLTQAQILRSFRGPKGGVTFAKPVEEISSYNVVVAIDGDSVFNACILALPGCSDQAPCPMHTSWKQIRSQLATMLQETTLADLSENVQKKNMRLTDLGNSILRKS